MPVCKRHETAAAFDVFNLLQLKACLKRSEIAFRHGHGFLFAPLRNCFAHMLAHLQIRLDVWVYHQDWNECTNVLVKCLLCEQALERI